ncbi:MAG: TonB-dependent receptor, partial [Chitinophagaceae bacterium]|nr:TonB-dependent receptor [Chitinophagaceae bacterium]
ANIYLSDRKNKVGYTFFTGTTLQQAVDVNKDAFSDVGKQRSFFINPAIYFYPDKVNTISIEYNGVFEDRKGGDMQVIENGKTGAHQFFIQNKIQRNTANVQWDDRISNTKRFTAKAIGSWFNRDINTNVFGMQARQLSYFSEAAYVNKFSKNDLVLGINFNGEQFKKEQPDSTQLQNFSHTTLGLFAQDDWRLHEKVTLQTGLRTDFNSDYGMFVLPRTSLLYHISSTFTTRLGGGLGYKIPTVFDSEIDERDYMKLLPLQNVKAERSYGGNWDINFHKRINKTDITINQAFYVTNIKDPLIINYNNGYYSLSNAAKGLITKGIETYVQLFFGDLETYLGYTLTDAKKLYDAAQPHLELSARNKFASVIAYTFSNRFRASVEAAVTGRQYLGDGTKTPAYPFVAAMIRYDIKNISIVVNCENVFDYRQTKKENIVSGSTLNPQFKQLWAPIDGRVVNLSVRFKF